VEEKITHFQRLSLKPTSENDKGSRMDRLSPPGHRLGVIIETTRLRLRPYLDDDLDRLVALAGNWEVARWLTSMPHPYKASHGRRWITHVRAAHQAGKPLSFAIALRTSDQLIGGGGLDGAGGDGGGGPALGYWLGQPYWGAGYGREALAAIIQYGFHTLKLETIQAIAAPDNLASQSILRACGLAKAAEIDLVTPMRTRTMRASLFRISRREYAPE
jgi:8-oxo-dGTP diphosphatase